ncbi:ATP-binding protein [Saccharomonospora iraqiensis]|uniref:ATP-binding protein n=1 Tax=Saccharomonospora iraqiensis TaxID=52698 RepID=UPI001F32C600|nr:ATP-binding protein [Saccharomonospora iraqiensis]
MVGPADGHYVPRLVDERLCEALEVFPAVLLAGPRAVGKTTTARRFAESVVELDDKAQAAPFRADPSAALRAVSEAVSGPVLLDEWQEVPEVLAAVKRAVDREARPGSFILTGSVRAPLTSASWPGTGRVITLNMHPLTVLERSSSGVPQDRFVSALLGGQVSELSVPETPPDLTGYLDLAVVGGYPSVVNLRARPRTLWLDSYVEQLVLRDVPELGDIRDAPALRRLLHALAECTGTMTADTELASAAGMNVKTVRRQERLLDDLRVVWSLPGWYTNRLSRLVKQRKRYATDTGLVAALLDVDTRGLLRNGELLERMLETFVLAQVRPVLEAVRNKAVAYHLRQQNGRREVDVVLETADGRVVGMEIKASASPSVADTRHLAWLRDELGDRFVAGIVLHTGKSIFPLDERITAVPIAALWA